MTCVSSEFGRILKISVFGQSHGTAIGVVVDGLPAGEAVDVEELQRFLDRRRPGTGSLSTARRETDAPEFLSGLENGKTCGAPLCAVIRNADQRSRDYGDLLDKPRPGHADYTAWAKWKGRADMRGGGHFSGRLTAPLCVAGGIARQLLARRGVFVGAHLAAVAGIPDSPFPPEPSAALFEEVAAKPFPVLDDQAGERMQAAILAAKGDLDSVGGVIECAAIGVPAGLGDPMFGRRPLRHPGGEGPGVRRGLPGRGPPGLGEQRRLLCGGGPGPRQDQPRRGRPGGHHHGDAHRPPGGGEAHAVHRAAPGDRPPLPPWRTRT